MNKGLKPISLHRKGSREGKKRNTDLMNKGLKLINFLLAYLTGHKRNTDLMNKGLKQDFWFLCVAIFPKRNTDLMNKGLKHILFRNEVIILENQKKH